MSILRTSTSVVRSGATSRPMRFTMPAYTRRATTGGGSEPSRSQYKPAASGETKSILPIAAAGLALGGAFFFLMSRPHNAPKVAHATGNNLKELSSRDSVDPATGTRMGTHRSD